MSKIYSEDFKKTAVDMVEQIGVQKTSLALEVPKEFLYDWERSKKIKDCREYTRKDIINAEELTDEQVQKMVAPLRWLGKDEEYEGEYPYSIGMNEDMFSFLENGHNWSSLVEAFIDNVMPELKDELLDDCEFSAFFVYAKTRTALIRFALQFKDLYANTILFHNIFPVIMYIGKK